MVSGGVSVGLWSVGMTAAAVGALHSLSPAHWVPIVLVMKARRWPMATALLGALVVAITHIVISVGVSAIAIELGMQTLDHYEEWVERYSGAGLIGFGLIYAWFAYRRHAGCRAHAHHHPSSLDPKDAARRKPFLFLFFLGLGPCVAAMPPLVAASVHGWAGIIVTSLCFSSGVLITLVGMTWLSTYPKFKLDHPFLEHYGDVLAGLGVAILGVVEWFH